MEHPVLLYDGVCGLCNRVVRFIIRHDPSKIFRFASLQSSFASRVTAGRAADPANFDSVYIVVLSDDGEELFERSEAVLFIMRKLGGVWRSLAGIAALAPRPIRDWAYAVVARNRYRMFGRYDTCPLPGEDDRERFIDI